MSDSDRRAPPNASAFGPVLARLRSERGLNQKELAKLIRRNPSTISRLESSGRGVSRELVDELAQALSASVPEHVEMLRAGGLLPVETATMLESPPLTRLSLLLAQPGLREQDRQILLTYVDLALQHAGALGYHIPPPWLPGAQEE